MADARFGLRKRKYQIAFDAVKKLMQKVENGRLSERVSSKLLKKLGEIMEQIQYVLPGSHTDADDDEWMRNPMRNQNSHDKQMVENLAPEDGVLNESPEGKKETILREFGQEKDIIAFGKKGGVAGNGNGNNNGMIERLNAFEDKQNGKGTGPPELIPGAASDKTIGQQQEVSTSEATPTSSSSHRRRHRKQRLGALKGNTTEPPKNISVVMPVSDPFKQANFGGDSSHPAVKHDNFHCDNLGQQLPRRTKMAILETTNRFRSKIAKGEYQGFRDKAFPPATNMRKVLWNCELEEKADKWARQCQMIHSGADVRRGQGECLHFPTPVPTSLEAFNATKMVDIFNGEFKKRLIDFPVKMDHFNWKFVGHATQQAWADNDAIGCASAFCGDKFWVVCRYRTGNNLGATIYDEGAPCTECPPGTTCNVVTSLCDPSN
ncbi:unnamed protein product, partial [Mesorhabditis spiculigera]